MHQNNHSQHKPCALFVLLAAFTMFFAASCSDEDTPEANTTPEPVWSNASLPQGNHDYDKTILELNKRYGILPLYRFDKKDYEWNVTSHNTWSYDSIRDRTNGGIEVEVADTNYVADLLALLQQSVLQFFPDSMVTKIFPMKVLLANTITNVSSTFTGKTPESQKTKENCYSGYDFLIFAGANSSTASMTTAQRYKYKSDAMEMIFDRAVSNGNITYPAEFATVSTYSNETINRGYQALGFFSSYVPTPSYDFQLYLENIVSMTTATMTSRYLNRYPRIKQKYDIVVSYMKEQYGIDLVAIADAQ